MKVITNKNTAFFVVLNNTLARFLLRAHFLCLKRVVVSMSLDSNEVNMGVEVGVFSSSGRRRRRVPRRRILG